MHNAYFRAGIALLALTLSGCDTPLWVSYSRPIQAPVDSWALGYQINLNSIVRNGPLVTYRARAIWKPSETPFIGYHGCQNIGQQLTAVVGKVTVNCEKRTIISDGEGEVLECNHSTYIATGRKVAAGESPPLPDIADSGDYFKYCSRFETAKAYVLHLWENRR